MTDNSPALSPAIQIDIVGGSGTKSFARSFHIGRAPGTDVIIDDDRVSQQHAAVMLSDGKWYLQDLGSSNGTFINGKRIDRARIVGKVQVRLGHDGPILILKTAGKTEDERPTVVSQPTESKILDRLLGNRTPSVMSPHTAMLRRVLRTEHRRRGKRYMVALAVLAVLVVVSGAIVYVQRQQIQRARAAAADLFYSMKSLELEFARLQLSAPELQSYREQRDRMQQQYVDYLEYLGIYSDATPQDLQTIYRTVHRFGESEVNVPSEFIEEIRRYIERWRLSGRLSEAVERAEQGNYAQIIGDILLEHDLPPEFIYLALQESNLKLEAVGPETRYGIAKGMWQLMPETARSFGLQTGPLVGVARFDPADERHQLVPSTRAAAGHLRYIYTTDAQASGLLVMASYNWGQGNVLRLIRTMPENPRDRNFWRLLDRYRDRIPQETYHYVFSIVSAAVIGENPALFGFDFDPLLQREQREAGAAPEDDAS
jgi:membrane-bound lytic murein transglycosylase D